MGLIGGLVGLVIGLEQAFLIRVGLHWLLCQVQIEENTRTQAAVPNAGALAMWP